MPELPEVQTIVNDLNDADLIGTAITGARILWPATIADFSPRAFDSRIRNQIITSIRRRGKYIVLEFSGPDTLIIHLRMTGRLHLLTASAPRSEHEHVILNLENQRHLRLHDTRKFARIFLVNDSGPILNRLGPEPLEPPFTAKELAKTLNSCKQRIKPLLLDQSKIAGLGNIYTDEALWDAKINPCQNAASLSWPEIKTLHRAIRRVLRRGLKNLGTSLGSGRNNFASIGQDRGYNREFLKVYQRTGRPCPRCKTAIKRILVGQRGTHICKTCQPLKN
ncbi:MAG: DNA-formamidopyrimidine glycosylase [Deltaproteobacteria bacterium CG1_02_45_11]|nr:MAG: DNA-formamidopyrimidine glycosylase [Deltaproteobacteria bacterium CG1_02_45_11]